MPGDKGDQGLSGFSGPRGPKGDQGKMGIPVCYKKKHTFFIYIVIKLLFFWIKGYPGINGVPVSFLHRFNWFYVITNRFWS